MRRKTLLLLIFATLAAGPASAAHVAPNNKALTGCEADFTRLCSGPSIVGVGGAGCLRQNYLSLSMRCRAALKATRPPS